MSLISDALKKAQRARSPDVPGGVGGAGRRPGGVPVKAVAYISIGAVVVIATIAGVVVAVLRHGDQAALAAAKSAPAAAATSTATVPPVTSPAPTTAPAPTIPAPVAPAVAEAALPVVRTPPLTAIATAPATASPAAKAATGVPPLAPTTSPAAITPEIRIQYFIDAIRITGLSRRALPTENRVQLAIGDKEPVVYRVNDIVDRQLNIRLIEIDETQLTFVDASGVKYTKRSN